MNVRRRDTGSATMWVVLALTLVWSVATWGLALSAVGSSRARASTAADLAALAGAAAAVFGDTSACASAERVAAANRATLRSCAVDVGARTVDVVVEAQRNGLLANGPPAMARARAGPHGALP